MTDLPRMCFDRHEKYRHIYGFFFYRLHVADAATATNPDFISVYSVMLSSKGSDFLHIFFYYKYVGIPGRK